MSGITTQSSSRIQTDYMKLLVTQLQNQNPLEPMDNKDMSAQLTRFSQLQQLEDMNTSFSSVLDNMNRSYADSLLGKDVTFKYEDKTGDIQDVTGNVEQVINDAEKGYLLKLQAESTEYLVQLGDIMGVKE